MFRWDACRAFRDKFAGLRWRQFRALSSPSKSRSHDWAGTAKALALEMQLTLLAGLPFGHDPLFGSPTRLARSYCAQETDLLPLEISRMAALSYSKPESSRTIPI
jgi:hypothetical protein